MSSFEFVIIQYHASSFRSLDNTNPLEQIFWKPGNIISPFLAGCFLDVLHYHISHAVRRFLFGSYGNSVYTLSKNKVNPGKQQAYFPMFYHL